MRAAADRRVEHCHVLLRQMLGDASRGERIDRAHAQHDVALFGGLDDAALAQDYRLRLGCSLDHADRAVTSGGDSLGRGFDPRSRCDQWLQTRRVDIVHDQIKPSLEKVERHRPAHITEPDKSDSARHCFPPCRRSHYGMSYRSAIGCLPSSLRTSLMICSTRSRYGRYWMPNSETSRVLSIR